MKLPIKKKWFDLIKSGEKYFEYRDAHITFICEETGETMTKRVCSVQMVSKNRLPDELKQSGLFEDKRQIEFLLV